MKKSLSSFPRRRESSITRKARATRQSLNDIELRAYWIPVCAGMTGRGLQRGFSLISAIFLLVVIAALGTFAVTLSTTQNQSQVLDVMGARGYQAALAGVEWAAYQVANSAASAPTATACTTTLNTLAGNLAPFTVAVTCNPTSAVEGVSTIWVYDVSAVAHTAGAAGDANYVEQVATAKLAN
jgi:MSHA biogenesis protein MshP